MPHMQGFYWKRCLTECSDIAKDEVNGLMNVIYITYSSNRSVKILQPPRDNEQNKLGVIDALVHNKVQAFM